MYFPYLVARGEEVEAVVATVCTYTDNSVIPILEPFNDEDDDVYSYPKLIKVVGRLLDHNKRFVLLVEDSSNLAILRERFNNLDDYCIHGYDSLNQNLNDDNNNIAIIHRSADHIIQDSNNMIYHIFMPSVLSFSSYLNRYGSEKKVLIEDGFIKHTPNNDYPAVEGFNSELCFTYRENPILGFGDFTILAEDNDISTGARANDITHVIHLSRIIQEEDLRRIRIYHYLTNPSEEPDPRNRSIRTIQKAYDDKANFLHTVGIRYIEDKVGQSTSLGMYKRIGIAHHIELMHTLVLNLVTNA